MAALAQTWVSIGKQLRNPTGFRGRLTGHAMGLMNEQSNQLAVAALSVRPEDTVLELGFGSGRAIQALAGIVARGRVFGIDHSPTMLTQATRRNRRAIREGRVHLLQGRFESLPWQSNSVDKVLAVHVAYFADAEHIREARRVLRFDGTIALLVTDRAAMIHWKFAQSSTHQLFGEGDLATLLIRGGFARDEIVVRQVLLSASVPGLLALASKAR